MKGFYALTEVNVKLYCTIFYIPSASWINARIKRLRLLVLLLLRKSPWVWGGRSGEATRKCGWRSCFVSDDANTESRLPGMDLDEAFQVVGEFGPYQKRAVAVLVLTQVSSSKNEWCRCNETSCPGRFCVASCGCCSCRVAAMLRGFQALPDSLFWRSDKFVIRYSKLISALRI